MERDEDVCGRSPAVVEVPAEVPVTPSVTVEGPTPAFRYLRAGVRTAVGPVLDFSRLSDDHLSRLRFTGGDGGDPCPGPRGRGVHGGLHRVSADLHT
ncbi:hypothetical protein OR263_13735 [Streptomyces sp. NEAU-H22]|uniref:hypothetical protein n=1 Tax=unclassified Streptomyces TaxID=2593676 RepID=UPI0022569333|nr:MULTISPECIES: hypothetical protein [unclassified Streptomyces]MCX3287750.1 hypothetical protein [Streptomyces sp. NEAU-H22]WMD04925.1 hypothetical protein Q7C01_11175 [Streptomyces sp. FXY-T5]